MLEELFNRVSIRHYQNREVEQAKLEEMLRAAMNAPTARNTQSWRFLVITNRETLNHMTELQPYNRDDERSLLCDSRYGRSQRKSSR